MNVLQQINTKALSQLLIYEYVLKESVCGLKILYCG